MTNEEKERLKDFVSDGASFIEGWRSNHSTKTKEKIEEEIDRDKKTILALIDRVPSEEEAVLRRLLWLHHGCPTISLYGDDGEMQCSKCGIDFKRMGAKDIERFWMSEQDKAIRKALNIEGYE